MRDCSLLGRDWAGELGRLVCSAKSDLFISSPYVTRDGAAFLLSNRPAREDKQVDLTVLTNLSAGAVCDGSTDPSACRMLAGSRFRLSLVHLPRLHAKAYIADSDRAIVTSGNLTRGGLSLNYEYGVCVRGTRLAGTIRRDLDGYAGLGAPVPMERLGIYCRLAEEARRAYRRQLAAATKASAKALREAVRAAEDELIRLRLAGGATHTVFARTIVYLLRRHGPLATTQLHPLIERIHPDLCDNSVDRVIDGKRFGKKWKHAVRTAQQQLKKRGVLTLRNTRWILVEEAPNDPQTG